MPTPGPARKRTSKKKAKKAASKPAKGSTRSRSAKAAERKHRAAEKTLAATQREASGANRDKAVTSSMIATAQDELAVSEGCWFDNEAADRVVGFFQGNLMDTRHADGARPLTLIEWQWMYLRTLYGWKRKNGLRRFRVGSCWVAKKNGKSLMNGGMALYGLCADGERMPEVYLAAADRDQAGIVFREAAAMVESSPVLRRLLNIVESTKRIHYPRLNGFIRALSREANTSEGINGSTVVVDELHAHRDAKLFGSLKYAGRARQQPITSIISTAGIKDTTGVGWREYDYAKKVRDGIIPITNLLPFIFEADPSDPIDDPKTWAKANPSLGITLATDDFAEDAKEARSDSAKLNDFLRYRLNIWTAQDFAWLNPEEWEACAGEPHETDPETLKGQPCYLGLDMASTQDTTAVELVFPPQGPDEKWAVLTNIFVPRDVVDEKSNRENIPYDRWVREGHMTATPGNATDYATIREFVRGLPDLYDIREVGLDLWNAAQLGQQLMEDGLEVVSVRPTFKDMSPPSKLLETLIAKRMIAHGGHPVLRWMAGNVAAETDVHLNLRPAKLKSKGKIDGIVAMLMAMARAMVADDKPGGGWVWG